MKVLLDTCVVSETHRAKPEPAVIAEVAKLREQAYISVITIGELLKGAHLMAEGTRQRELMKWLEDVQEEYAQRTYDVDREIAQRWGRIDALAQKRGRQIQPADGLIAATALRHGLPVMTRNVSDFEPTGVDIINPWPQ